MPRPPAFQEGDKLKTFIVRPFKIIADNDGVRKEGGDEIQLTYAQAKHFKAQGVIEVPLEDFSNEPNADDSAETPTGDQADGQGELALGDPFAKALPSGD